MVVSLIGGRFPNQLSEELYMFKQIPKGDLKRVSGHIETHCIH